MTDQARVISEEIAWQGKWIRTKIVRYVDEKGVERPWEAYERTNFNQSEVGAVIIIPIISFKDKENQIILVKQFRPGAGSYCLEFPAGLCDKSELPEATALRELQEETGYKGTIERVTSMFGASVALGNTKVKCAIVRIDGDHEDNQNPKTNFDEGEFTETIFVPVKGLPQHLKEYAVKYNCVIDVSLGLFAEASSLAL